jgi:hypothetical protein
MKSGLRILIVFSIVIYITAGGIFLMDSAAQNIKAADGLSRGCFDLKDDMRSYEVMYKEYGEEYGNYYRAVREKIVQRLKCNYKDHYSQGDVDLFFVLNSNGSISRIDVDIDRSVNSKVLIDVAVLSLQQASPFQPFPRDMDALQLPFSLTVSFKEKNN